MARDGLIKGQAWARAHAIVRATAERIIAPGGASSRCRTPKQLSRNLCRQWPIALAALALVGCATAQRDVPTATATLQPTAGNAANGTVKFEQHGDMVRVSGTVSGLLPNSEHGFHVHEKGDCSAPDASSAGGHFNPLKKEHGHAVPGGRHAGDMPNLRANSDGRASFSIDLRGMTVADGETSILGKSAVVHAKPDDYRSQPSGDSGARIACGVIGKR